MAGTRGRLIERLARLMVFCQDVEQLPPIERIATEFGVSERTISRDLAALDAAGWPTPPRYMEHVL